MMPLPRTRQGTLLACVLLAHGAALWVQQHGLMQRLVDTVTPAEVLTEISLMDSTPPTPPTKAPKLLSPLPQPTKAATASPLQATPRAVQQTPAAPTPLAVAAPAPAEVPLAAPAATAAHSAAAPTSTAAATPSNTANAAAVATATPVKVQLPSSDADYLNTPKPAYPAMSRRLGEQGRVIVHTLIGEDGVPQKAEVQRSSGFERLDRAAVDTAMRWRYVPGKRAGVAEAMWFNLPMNFVLD